MYNFCQTLTQIVTTSFRPALCLSIQRMIYFKIIIYYEHISKIKQAQFFCECLLVFLSLLIFH